MMIITTFLCMFQISLEKLKIKNVEWKVKEDLANAKT